MIKNPFWVSCKKELPTGTRYYIGKTCKGKIVKAHFSKSKGGFFDYLISVANLIDQEEVIYWLKGYSKTNIDKLPLPIIIDDITVKGFI